MSFALTVTVQKKKGFWGAFIRETKSWYMLPELLYG
jgi:hypothetical protein